MTAMTALPSGGAVSTITVRGLDDEVIRALKVRAAQGGRSMEAEVRSILTSAAAGAEGGFGTFLANAFEGLGEVDTPARKDLPEPVDLP